jgi:CBS-domain-containing membrane protein
MKPIRNLTPESDLDDVLRNPGAYQDVPESDLETVLKQLGDPPCEGQEVPKPN